MASLLPNSNDILPSRNILQRPSSSHMPKSSMMSGVKLGSNTWPLGTQPLLEEFPQENEVLNTGHCRDR